MTVQEPPRKLILGRPSPKSISPPRLFTKVHDLILLDHRDRSLAGRVEEGRGYDFCGYGFAFGFYGHFDVERGAEGGVLAVDTGQGDHFFQSGRPRGGSGFSDLAATAVDGNGDAGSHAGNLRGHANFFVDSFDFVPVDFKADERARGAVFCFRGECVLSDKVFFFQIHQFAEADFRRASSAANR